MSEALAAAAQPASERRMLSLVVDNAPGVLMRISALFRRRGINIHSLAVSVTEDPKISRITMVVDCPAARMDVVLRQLRKLIEVHWVRDITDAKRTERELALVKVNASPEVRHEVLEAARVFRARPVDLTERTVTLEVTGGSEKIDALIDVLRQYGIREVVRTGAIALLRGTAVT
ncbi:MAG: acetolactate synthase small subunit [Armatimonadota bacterium]|nr:acetolactate synthase small subunit [Armatimonadota bacterium]MDR7570767.1 acetolactate synthase small subunit [Armatimonadota bacterium]MDR7614308.1 acetolactate synthase small subunit [Armatimonadota bacterium]